MRSAGRSFWRLIGRPWVLTLAVVMLAVSAISGNVFQNADRSSLKSDLEQADQRIKSLEGQLDDISGEQECRSRIAAASETQSGRILLAIADLVIASRDRNDELGDVALAAVSSARTLLGPALDDREESVELCKANPNYRTKTTPFTEVTADEPTTTTTVRRTATRRPTTTTTGSTTTTFHSSPSPTSPPCTYAPLPVEIPCL